jgi:hypothetical protein
VTREDYEEWLGYFTIALEGTASCTKKAPSAIAQMADAIAVHAVDRRKAIFATTITDVSNFPIAPPAAPPDRDDVAVGPYSAAWLRANNLEFVDNQLRTKAP